MNYLFVRWCMIAAFCGATATGCKTPMTYDGLHKWVNSQDSKMIGPQAIYPQPEELRVPSGMSIAFVRYYQNLGPAKPNFTEPFLHVRVMDMKTTKIQWAIPRQHTGLFPKPPVGDFHDIMLWFLPPGEYTLMDVHAVKTEGAIGGTVRGNRTVPIDGKFTIEKEGEVVYLTDLSAMGQGMDFGVSLKDNYAEAVEEFRRTYVNARGTSRNASVKATPAR